MDLKQLIEGRIDALAKVHALFVQSRWAGAELRNLVSQELLAYSDETQARVRIDGPAVMLEPYSAQAIAITLQSSRPTRQNTDRCRRRQVVLKLPGRARQTDGSFCAGSSWAGRQSRRPRTAGSARALWRTYSQANSRARCVLIGATKGSPARSFCLRKACRHLRRDGRGV
jgi:hypothetical protein